MKLAPGVEEREPVHYFLKNRAKGNLTVQKICSILNSDDELNSDKKLNLSKRLFNGIKLSIFIKNKQSLRKGKKSLCNLLSARLNPKSILPYYGYSIQITRVQIYLT